MEYVPTFGSFLVVNVGKYSIHGASGYGFSPSLWRSDPWRITNFIAMKNYNYVSMDTDTMNIPFGSSWISCGVYNII